MKENEQNNEKRETVADVVAIVRRAAQYYDGEAEKSEGLLRESFKLSADNYRAIADLVEAAWKRDEERAVEHATRHAEAVARDNCRDCVHNPNGKNYEGGNAAAMREACAKMRQLLMLRGDGKTHCILSWEEFNESQKMLRAALSAPARNCDVGTAEEQANRMRQFCANQKRNGIINCGYCPIKHQYERDCTLSWAQMPYAAEEGGADGVQSAS